MFAAVGECAEMRDGRMGEQNKRKSRDLSKKQLERKPQEVAIELRKLTSRVP